MATAPAITVEQIVYVLTATQSTPQISVSSTDTTVVVTETAAIVTATQTTNTVEIIPNGIVAMRASSSATVDVFSGNGIQTIFNLSAIPLGPDFVEVIVGGVTQTPVVSYVASTSTVTFSQAPFTGTNNVMVIYYDILVGQNIKGDTGAQGVQGIQGTRGIQGPTGIQGIQGVQGLDGAYAAQGIQGPTGIQGPFGPQGVQGLNGAYAAQGVQGAAGSQGANTTTWATLGDKTGWYGPTTIALGRFSGYNQGIGGVAIGLDAGGSGQGNYSVAVGYQAGYYNQHANTTVLNATGDPLPSISDRSFYVKPVRNSITADILYYDGGTGEISYGAGGGVNYAGPASGSVVVRGNRAGAFSTRFSEGTNLIIYSGLSGRRYRITPYHVDRTNPQLPVLDWALFRNGELLDPRLDWEVMDDNQTFQLSSKFEDDEHTVIMIIGPIGDVPGDAAWPYMDENLARVAIGAAAASIQQGTNSLAVGVSSGNYQQGNYSVAAGNKSGMRSQGEGSVAIGNEAGLFKQGINSIAIGNGAGRGNSTTLGQGIRGPDAFSDYGQGNYSIAIGYMANANTTATTTATSNSIVLNATATELNAPQSGLYVKPIRHITNGSLPSGFYNMAYNPTTGEIIYWT